MIRIPIELSEVKHDIKKQKLANWKRKFCASCQFSQLDFSIIEKQDRQVILFNKFKDICVE